MSHQLLRQGDLEPSPKAERALKSLFKNTPCLIQPLSHTLSAQLNPLKKLRRILSHEGSLGGRLYFSTIYSYSTVNIKRGVYGGGGREPVADNKPTRRSIIRKAVSRAIYQYPFLVVTLTHPSEAAEAGTSTGS